MNSAKIYLKKYPVTFIAFTIYCICWGLLFTPFPAVIGEWPIAPIIALPFSILILLNCIFREGHRLFYFFMAIIIGLPFFILSLLA
jgi:hypothetical protein